MALSEQANFNPQFRQIRGSGRLNSRVAVAVEWTDGSQNLRAEGYTVDISAKGCLAVVPQGFNLGQKLRLVNLTNQISCEAVLVWRGHEGRTGWELGLELQEPLPESDQPPAGTPRVFHRNPGGPTTFPLPMIRLRT